MLPNQFKRVNLLPSPAKSSKSNIKAPSQNLIRFAGGGYMVCSSLMLITNKLAVHNVPAPGFVLFAQLFTSGM